jgi:hypothetical protein
MTREMLLTDPIRRRFVKSTQPDALAIAIRHQPRRMQVFAQAHRDIRRSIASRKSTPAFRIPTLVMRLVVGASGICCS